MNISAIDYAVIGLYFLIVLAIGFWASKKASTSLESYFLGGRSISCLLLGLAGMTTYIDISGTMLQSSFYYLFGVKGFILAFRGAIPLILSFLMIFVAKWLTRTRVMTNAELMEFRFGSGIQGHAARLMCAVSILIIAVALCAFIFYGAGKFLSQYFPTFSPSVCILIFFLVVLVYTVVAGFYGVVYTDLFQSLLIIAAVIFLVIKAFKVGTPEYLQQYADPSWQSISLADWKQNLPAGSEGFSRIGVLLFIWISSAMLLGFAFPHDPWTSQKFYAAKNERESSLTAFIWIVTFSVRFALFMAVGILAISLKDKITEPEMALPAVIEYYMPIGFKGIMISALLAAGMSTVDGVVNSSAVYFVRDIYKLYLRPKASDKHILKLSYLVSFLIMTIGAVVGMTVQTISDIWGWIALGLFTGVIASNTLKWFWWRFNGAGYAAGMIVGVTASIIKQLLFPQLSEYAAFSFILALSTLGAILGTFLASPTGSPELKNFFLTVRPFGFWNKVRENCDPADVASIKKENTRDLLLLVPACLWQIVIYWIMTCVVLKNWNYVTAGSVAFIILSAILYQYWYKNLPPKNQPNQSPARK